jgi:hypothetical protein
VGGLGEVSRQVTSLLLRAAYSGAGMVVMLFALALIAFALRSRMRPSRAVAIAITLIALLAVAYQAQIAYHWARAYERVAVTGDARTIR